MNKFTLLKILIFLLIFIVGVTVAYNINTPDKTLKIYQPFDVNPELVAEQLRNKRGGHTIADFELFDQNGNIASQKNFEDKIYVADFFFTTCPSICPKMADQMQRVYEKYKNDNRVMFLSHTVMPEVDSVPVLLEYAKKYQASSDKWVFVTGSKKAIYELARESYFAVTTTGNGDEHDFIHTENFILVDAQKRIRGFYDGTDKKDIDRLMDEMDILVKESEKALKNKGHSN